MGKPFPKSLLPLSLLVAACSSEPTEPRAPDSKNEARSGGTGGAASQETTGGASSWSTGGATASGGAGSSSGGTATGGAAAGGVTGTGGSDPVCSGLEYCDDFESTAAGSPPDPTKWRSILNYSGRGDPANVAVDNTEAHSGSHSLKVVGTSGLWGFSPLMPPGSFFLRTWIKFSSSSYEGNPALFGAGTGTAGDELKVRVWQNDSVNEIYFFGTDSKHSGAVPLVGRASGCPECAQLPLQWFCLEIEMDVATETMTTWVDGMEAISAPASDVWPGWPTFVNEARLGVMALNGSGPTIWIDDVAFSDARLGCD